MKKIITVSLFAMLALGVPRARAWWLFDCHRCCVKICCRQYNAFSPFCCQGPGGSFPMPGYGSGGSPACGIQGGEGYASELPAPEAAGAPGMNGTTAPPANNGTNPSSSVAVPGQNLQSVPPGVAPRPLPAWGAGVTNPIAPGYYPGFSGHYGPMNGSPAYYSGFPGYGPMNGVPSYPSGFPGYAPANGNPSSYPSYPSYGPGNGIGR